jgi:hypothetical protein
MAPEFSIMENGRETNVAPLQFGVRLAGPQRTVDDRDQFKFKFGSMVSENWRSRMPLKLIPVKNSSEKGQKMNCEIIT